MEAMNRPTEKRIEALADLDEVRKAVFGDVGDEPNVYADYDRCSELSGKMRKAISTLSAALAVEVGTDAPYEFDRYINGTLMAEGIRVERASSYEQAYIVAARIASRGSNGESPVLVLRTTPGIRRKDE